MKKLLWNLVLFFVSFSLTAQVSPILPGQNLWCITQRIGETTDTILDRINSLLDCPCSSTTSLTCAPTIISAGVGEVITISVAGNYCLATDLTADISLLGNNITLDLNNRILTGLVTVGGGEINILNGDIIPPAPEGPSPLAAAVTLNVGGYVRILNCIIDCALNGALGGAADGRTAILVNQAAYLELNNCLVKAGNGANAIEDLNGGMGGDAFVAIGASSKIVLHNCLFISGDGGDAGTQEGGIGGAGGIALNLQDVGTLEPDIRNCKMYGGRGGNGSPSTPNDGGNAALACVRFVNIKNLIMQNCEIVPGLGGIAGEDGSIGNNGNFGNCGSGIYFFGTSGGLVENCTVWGAILRENWSSITGDIGGNGSVGIAIDVNTKDLVISSCVITGGAATSGNTTQGAGGIGISLLNNSAIENTIIQNCIVSGGNGGNDSGIGGDCIKIDGSGTGPQNTLVKNCVFPRAGIGIPFGKAVNDLVSDAGPVTLSTIYGNLAQKVGDLSSVKYTIHGLPGESGFLIDLLSTTAINPFANYFTL